MINSEQNDIYKLESDLISLRDEIKGLKDMKEYYQTMLLKTNCNLEHLTQRETDLVKSIEDIKSLRNEKLINSITEKLKSDNNFVILLEELLRQYAKSGDTSLDVILESTKV